MIDEKRMETYMIIFLIISIVFYIISIYTNVSIIQNFAVLFGLLALGCFGIKYVFLDGDIKWSASGKVRDGRKIKEDEEN